MSYICKNAALRLFILLHIILINNHIFFLMFCNDFLFAVVLNLKNYLFVSKIYFVKL